MKSLFFAYLESDKAFFFLCGFALAIGLSMIVRNVAVLIKGRRKHYPFDRR